MPKQITKRDEREAAHVMGEMAAAQLFALIHERLAELKARDPTFTQSVLAKRLGVSEQLVSRWLTEPRNLTIRSAGRLLAALEAQLLFELDRFEDMAVSNATMAFPATTVVYVGTGGGTSTVTAPPDAPIKVVSGAPAYA